MALVAQKLKPNFASARNLQFQLSRSELAVTRKTAAPASTLQSLVNETRLRHAVDATLPDAAILASLEAICARTSLDQRWRAAFDSPLGRWLALNGSDLNTALNDIIAMLPDNWTGAHALQQRDAVK